MFVMIDTHLEKFYKCNQPQGSSPVLTWYPGSYGASTGLSGIVSCGDMQVCFSLEL